MPMNTEDMTTINLLFAVQQWAEDRGIVANSTPIAQLMKTVSELGELADATLKRDEAGIKDGIGDVLVTLIIYAQLQGLTIRECLAHAYDTIKDRKGKLTPEGIFVKEEN
jgi:NTP pyrophosphatase (non-canonical NTP hydrolase)